MSPLQAPLSHASCAAGLGVRVCESQTVGEYTTGNEPAEYLHGIHTQCLI